MPEYALVPWTTDATPMPTETVGATAHAFYDQDLAAAWSVVPAFATGVMQRLAPEHGDGLLELGRRVLEQVLDDEAIVHLNTARVVLAPRTP